MKAPVTIYPRVVGQAPKKVERGSRALDHADRHGVVQRHDRVVFKLKKEAVERGYLAPVGGVVAFGFVVDGGDGRLELVRPGRSASGRPSCNTRARRMASLTRSKRSNAGPIVLA